MCCVSFFRATLIKFQLYWCNTTYTFLLLFLSGLHLPGLVTATPSSSGWMTLTLTRTRVPSAPTWRMLSPASSWRSVTRTCCSTSCHHTPAAWLVCSMCWATTTKIWASSTSLFHRQLWTRWGRWRNQDESFPVCIEELCKGLDPGYPVNGAQHPEYPLLIQCVTRSRDAISFLSLLYDSFIEGRGHEFECLICINLQSPAERNKKARWSTEWHAQDSCLQMHCDIL